MNTIHCVDGWLGHLWNTDGTCKRGCGATGRTLVASTLADAQSHVEAPVLVHPAGRIDQHGSVRHRLRLVRGFRA